MSEMDFIRGIVQRTGCGLLLDLNNVFVSATNHGYSALDYLSDFPIEHVGEIHLRSEEHTSELQSLRHLVCRLLLEKKKKNIDEYLVLHFNGEQASMSVQ